MVPETEVVGGQTLEDISKSGVVEIGSGTRRRPIKRDYAAAKDAEVGKKKVRRSEGRKVGE